MQKITTQLITEKAAEYNKSGIPWHHHFLTPACFLNETEDFRVILENEKSGEKFFCDLKQKPHEELEKLERLFFRREE